MGRTKPIRLIKAVRYSNDQEALVGHLQVLGNDGDLHMTIRPAPIRIIVEDCGPLRADDHVGRAVGLVLNPERSPNLDGRGGSDDVTPQTASHESGGVEDHVSDASVGKVR